MNPIIDKYGTKKWCNENDDYHRINGPAIVCGGYKAWYENNKRHRLDGPAIKRDNGDKEWWVNGKRHRLDGPAIERDNGPKEWYINNKELSEDLHTKLTVGGIKDLPLYLGLGFDDYISERLK